MNLLMLYGGAPVGILLPICILTTVYSNSRRLLTMNLNTLVTKMIEVSIENHFSDRKSYSGKTMPSAGQPLDHVLVTLSPADMLAVANDPSLIPKYVNGVEVKISEKPSPINKPHSSYMLLVMCKWNKNGKIVGSIGRSTVRESA